MKLKKVIMILAIIHFNLGMNNQNQNLFNESLIQRNPNYLPINGFEIQLSDILNEGSIDVFNVTDDLEINNNHQNQNNQDTYYNKLIKIMLFLKSIMIAFKNNNQDENEDQNTYYNNIKSIFLKLKMILFYNNQEEYNEDSEYSSEDSEYSSEDSEYSSEDCEYSSEDCEYSSEYSKYSSEDSKYSSEYNQVNNYNSIKSRFLGFLFNNHQHEDHELINPIEHQRDGSNVILIDYGNFLNPKYGIDCRIKRQVFKKDYESFLSNKYAVDCGVERQVSKNCFGKFWDYISNKLGI
jgi:hypothetical protein